MRYEASFVESGVFVSVVSNAVGKDELLRFVEGLRVEIPR